MSAQVWLVLLGEHSVGASVCGVYATRESATRAAEAEVERQRREAFSPSVWTWNEVGRGTVASDGSDYIAVRSYEVRP